MHWNVLILEIRFPRRAWNAIAILLLGWFLPLAPACTQNAPRSQDATTITNPSRMECMPLDNDTKDRLTAEQYHITQEKGTERAFTGKYWNTHTKGVYTCVCCGESLFDSETKYDSGSGWPSFYAPYSGSAISEKNDHSFMMQRTEVVCSNCGAHLGHVFDDGPEPTGLRYCINSAALNLKESPKSEEE